MWRSTINKSSCDKHTCMSSCMQAKFPVLTPSERMDVMASHLTHAWRMWPSLSAWLSHAWLPYRVWKKLYSKTPVFWPWSHLVFYDIWVTRDLNGKRFFNRVPYTQDKLAVDSMQQGHPFPAYCCWNGMVVLSAQPFKQQGVHFRSHAEGECAGSECSLLCDDFHRANASRVLIDPGVRAVYDWVSAQELYRNMTANAPLGVHGASYRAYSGEAGAMAQRMWGEWLPRIHAGSVNVECWGIMPGKETADFDAPCTHYDVDKPLAGTLGQAVKGEG